MDYIKGQLQSCGSISDQNLSFVLVIKCVALLNDRSELGLVFFTILLLIEYNELYSVPNQVFKI